ncbi:MAG: flagellar basal body rod protein FlgB [Verrucomicrobiae bacterium]
MEIVSSLFENPGYQATKAMLDVATVKHQAVAANIANSSTPGYKRVQVSKTFEQELMGRIKSKEPLDLAGLKPTLEKDPNAISSRMDGNNVELDSELLQMSTNSTNYQVLTQFINGSFRQLRSAITGRSA